MDGEWEAPLVPNPKCKTASGCGEWSPPLIDNPNYKGKWKPPMIENPNYQVMISSNNINNTTDYHLVHLPFSNTLRDFSSQLQVYLASI